MTQNALTVLHYTLHAAPSEIVSLVVFLALTLFPFISPQCLLDKLNSTFLKSQAKIKLIQITTCKKAGHYLFCMPRTISKNKLFYKLFFFQVCLNFGITKDKKPKIYTIESHTSDNSRTLISYRPRRGIQRGIATPGSEAFRDIALERQQNNNSKNN